MPTSPTGTPRSARYGPAILIASTPTATASHASGSRRGSEVRRRAFIDDLAAGTFVVDCLTVDELNASRAGVAKYRDLRLGLAGASLIVLAKRYGTRRILTFDERRVSASSRARDVVIRLSG